MCYAYDTSIHLLQIYLIQSQSFTYPSIRTNEKFIRPGYCLRFQLAKTSKLIFRKNLNVLNFFLKIYVDRIFIFYLYKYYTPKYR